MRLCASTAADHQKTVWQRAKDNKEHDEQFISSGLWSVSRHPKYVSSKTFTIVLASTAIFKVFPESVVQFYSRNSSAISAAPLVDPRPSY